MTFSNYVKQVQMLLLLIFLLPLAAYAQYTKYHSEDKKALKYYEEARAYLKRAQFYEAMPLLQKSVERDPDFIEVWLAFGSTYNRLGKDSLSLASFQRALEIDPDYQKSKYVYHAIGDVYFKEGKFDQAKEYFQHYLRTKHTDPRKADDARDKIENCIFALAAQQRPYDYNMQELLDSANSFQLQYFAQLSVDMQRLYFTRRVGTDPMQDEDIFYCDRTSSGWSTPRSISPQVNTDENEGASSVSADGRTLVFTSCNDRKGYGSCDLYVSEKQGGKWSKPVNMGREINSPAWEAQPTLSADGRTIYFVSNRAGGHGRKDIWAAQKDKKGYWEPAFNLGNRINTKRDDIAPFIHANGETIYFSSKGHENMGGLDFFVSELQKDSVWSKPSNLGYPLNDSHDQVSLNIASDGKTGIIAIEKEGEGRMDSRLFSIQLPDTFRVTNQSKFWKGTITDKESGLPIEATVKIYNLDNKYFYSELSSDVETGDYTIVLTEGKRYGVYVTSPGYVFHDFKFDMEDMDAFDDNVLDVQLQPIRVGARTVLGNIFFDHNSYELKEESMSELREVYRFLRKNRGVVIEISGHTDASGSKSYNQTLSEKRAKAVFDLLVSKRVPAHRLAYKGYADDELVDSDPLSHKNRRIEFKILSVGE